MGRRVAGVSLLELILTIGLLGILAFPLAGVITQHLRASLTTDDSTAAANLARYEQELFEIRGLTASWCSVRRAALPPSDPNRASCPSTVSGLNPYAGLPWVVYRINAAQAATDGSSGLRRITVIVKGITQQSPSGTITALAPLVTVVAYQALGVGFGT